MVVADDTNFYSHIGSLQSRYRREGWLDPLLNVHRIGEGRRGRNRYSSCRAQFGILLHHEIRKIQLVAKSKSGIKSRNWDHILTYCLRLCCLNCANTSSSEALHYITRNLLPKINTIIQSTNYVIHFIFFYDKNIIINSSMKTAILPFLGYYSSSVAFRQPTE